MEQIDRERNLTTPVLQKSTPSISYDGGSRVVDGSGDFVIQCSTGDVVTCGGRECGIGNNPNKIDTGLYKAVFHVKDPYEIMTINKEAELETINQNKSLSAVQLKETYIGQTALYSNTGQGGSNAIVGIVYTANKTISITKITAKLKVYYSPVAGWLDGLYVAIYDTGKNLLATSDKISVPEGITSETWKDGLIDFTFSTPYTITAGQDYLVAWKNELCVTLSYVTTSSGKKGWYNLGGTWYAYDDIDMTIYSDGNIPNKRITHKVSKTLYRTILPKMQNMFDFLYLRMKNLVGNILGYSTTLKPSRTIDVSANVVAQYKMNDNADNKIVVDEKGTNGTSVRNTSLLAGTGQINGSLKFVPASLDFINTNQNFNTTFNNSFSITAWARAVDGRDTKRRCIFGENGFAGNDAYLYLQAGRIYLGYGAGLAGAETEGGALLGSGDTGWIFVTAKVESIGTSCLLNIYLNGALYNTYKPLTPIAMSSFTTAVNFGIGRVSATTNSTYYFNGNIDNVCIYNTALTSEQILALYNNGVGTEGHSKTFLISRQENEYSTKIQEAV